MRTALLAALLALPAAAGALPQYAVRSGRTCGNCHLSPTYEDPAGWANPELGLRKCSMSCVACHVNPAGGGLRNTSGRYYGQSTLSMLPLQERSYSDYGRELFSQATIRGFRGTFMGGVTRTATAPGGRPRAIPSSWAEVERGVGREVSGDLATFGEPAGAPSELALWGGRYGDLAPDPLLALGGELRVAYWSASERFFPMQLDLSVALHPIEHLTALGTLAARGRVAGLDAAVTSEPAPVFARSAFLMAHELPYMAYAKAGIFQPAFGTHLDDHTSFVRRYFEQDVSKPEDVVLGAELGAAPNYPFVGVSVFRNFIPFEAPSGIDPGWGAALNLGWRDLAWHASAHAMIKRRDPAARGDLEAAGIAWGLNPFAWWNEVPVTLLGELDVGRLDAPGTSRRRTVIALYSEAWIVIANGLSVRVKYDYGDRDLASLGTTEHRLGAMIDLSPIPGVTLIGGPRLLWAGERDLPSADVLVQTHLWF